MKLVMQRRRNSMQHIMHMKHAKMNGTLSGKHNRPSVRTGVRLVKRPKPNLFQLVPISMHCVSSLLKAGKKLHRKMQCLFERLKRHVKRQPLPKHMQPTSSRL